MPSRRSQAIATQSLPTMATQAPPSAERKINMLNSSQTGDEEDDILISKGEL